MTLKEKFDNVEIMFENQVGSLKYDELSEASNQCEVIAEQFAIEFADWIKVCNRKGRPYDFENIKELLEIYKEEKEL
jgi:virulence-associated protein VapD